MSEWKEYKLGELCSKIGSGATPRGGGEVYKESGVSLIRSQNVLDFKFSVNGLAFIDDLQANDLKNVIVQEDDILLNITGDSVARACKVPFKILPARVNQHVAIIRSHKSKLNSNFLLYYLVGIKEELLSISEIGATRRAITKGMLESLKITIPKFEMQTAIASILSSLDDKIDLLNRQNATLEKMAETLFRQWFIHRPELVEGEEAKEEWEEISLFDSINLVGGGTPKTSIDDFWNGPINWLSGGDIAMNHKSFVTSSEKSITQKGLNNSSAKLLPKYATVISARGTVGKYCLLSEPMTFSQSNYGVLPKFRDCFFFTYLLIAYSVDELQSAAYGSVFDTITTNTFKGLILRLPDESYIYQFEQSVKVYFDKILTNEFQIRTLTAMRDTLLPKLMSGEVRVKM